MYEAHFGLQGRPFDTGIAHDVDVFRGGRQNAVIDKAKLALGARDSVVTFSGPPGVGKTTLALATIRSISTRLALAWLSSMPTNANEMLELLLVELGVNAHRATRIERLQMWRQYLEEMSATETRVFVIAERTEEFAPEVLRALDALTGTDASGSPGANVVLLGHQGLDAFLGSPSLESLRQRIRLRQRFEPFSSAELTDYLRHRVTQVGGDFARLFAPGAAAAVYRMSGGVARIANTLCEAALTAAATTNKPALTPELISQVAVDMLGLDEHRSAPPTQAAPTPPVAPPGTVTIASVAIDITPAKTAAVVAAPKNASAAPRVAEAPVAPAPAPTTPAPPPTIATAPMPAATTPTVVRQTPAPAPVQPLAQAAPTPAAPVTAPVATVAVAPAPVVGAPVAPAPLPPPAVRPAPIAKPPPSAAAPRMPLPDFDATATDIPDVSSFDFPVLTDAVEQTAPRAPPVRTPVTPPSAPVTPALAAKPPVAPPPMPRTSSAPAPHAPTPPLSRPPAAAVTPPPRRLLEPKAAAPSAAPPSPAPPVEDERDPERQTQTMRALSKAKSIDDVSDSMAETLFGEAELDFLSAALASAVGESESDESPVSAAASHAGPRPSSESPPDDLMDLFNLGPDAPLELIDDSVAPEGDQRKTARRS